MSLPDFAVKKKVTVSMIFLAILIIGIISLAKLNISLLPDLEFPKISILTSYENASPNEVKNLITKPMEETLSSVPGVKSIRSKSIEGLSIVTLSFQWGADMDLATLGVSENAERIRTFLPQEAEKPIILKIDPTSKPIFILSLKSKTISKNYFKRFIKKEIKTRLERIKGVGSVNIVGARERIIDIETDLSSLVSYKLTLSEIMQSIANSNYNFPAGNIEKGDQEFLIRTIGRFHTLKEISNTIVKTTDEGVIIPLYQIAKIKNTLKEVESVALLNGEDTVALELKKEAGSNTVAVCSKIKEVITELEDKYQNRIEISIIQDSSIFIKTAVENVFNAAIFGAVLAFIILFFFLKDFKFAVIIVLSIPFAILFTFILMFLFGLSINMMSLGGLALGIGMLVDNSIVVLENINRLKGKNLSLVEACIVGTKTVQKSIIGSTLTSVIVFLPLIFLKGLIGALFKEMAYTITFSLLSSILIAVLLIPMLTSLELRKNKIQNKQNFLNKSSDYIYGKIENRFEKTFSFFFKRKKFFFISLIICFSCSIFLFTNIKQELMPPIQEKYLSLWVKMPEGTTIETTRRMAKRIGKKIKGFSFVSKVFCYIGADKDNLVAKMDDKSSKNMANFSIFLKKSYSLDSAFYFLKQIQIPESEEKILEKPLDIISSLVSNSANDLLIKLEGKNTESLLKKAESISHKLQTVKGIDKPVLSISKGRPEAKIIIDKKNLASFGLGISSVGQILKYSVQGEEISRYYEGDFSIPMRVRLKKSQRKNIKDLLQIRIPISNDTSIPLYKIAKIKKDTGKNKIERENQTDVIYIKSNYNQAASSSISKYKILSIIKKEKQNIKNTDIYSINIIEKNTQFKESFSQLKFMFLLSIVFVYMIIASLFESIISPMILMLSIPLGLIGITPLLFFTESSINIMSGMGLIMLGGITINSAVVLLEFIQQEENMKYNLKSIIFKVGKIRLKPILMSTLTTILGLLPLALGLGEGTDMQKPLALTVIGGLIVSTTLTLFLIPIIYYLYKNKNQ